MKKVLLIGELSDIVRSINECLSDDFNVQLCSEHIESVQGMVKIIKPDLIVFCQIGVDNTDCTIFEWLQSYGKKMPVLIITTNDGWKLCKGYCETGQFDKMFRPVMKGDLIDKCYHLLNMKRYINAGKSELEPKRILIVDDSPMVLRSIKGILGEKYDVFLAVSGEQALKMIPQKQPDLVILDYEMPGMSGKDTFEAMLDDEYAKEIPVVFLTSIADRSQIYSVLKSYPAGYILKPPDRDKLLGTVGDILKSGSL